MFNKLGLILFVVTGAYLWQTFVKQGPIYKSDKSLVGKTVFLTGGNAGIGRVTAIEIAKLGARLIIASRKIEKSEAVKDEIIEMTGNDNIRVMKLDLENYESIRSVTADLITTEKYIDFVVNNAGAMFLGGLTDKGLGRTFTINHLGHFLLTNLLLDKLKSQSVERPVRIINLSSDAYKLGTLDWENLHYDPDGFFQNMKVYADSKLANIYFTSELNKRLEGFDITTFAVHPGIIYSELGNSIPLKYKFLTGALALPFVRDTYYGVQTTMYTLLDDDVVNYSGQYFSDCKLQSLWSHALNETLGKELWDKSMEMVELR